MLLKICRNVIIYTMKNLLFNKRRYLRTLIVILSGITVLFLSGCTNVKTDISQQEAEVAAKEIVVQAQNTLNSAEIVYIYAFPEMLKNYGDAIWDMDAADYFEHFSELLKGGKTAQPGDQEIRDAMEAMGFLLKTGEFSMDNYTAGMSSELMAVPEKMQKMIKEYDEAKDSNQYLKLAHDAYQLD